MLCRNANLKQGCTNDRKIQGTVSPYNVMLITGKETVKRSSDRFIIFIKHAYSLGQSTRLPLYSCKYSRRDYTQHQLLTLIHFKEYRKEDSGLTLNPIFSQFRKRKFHARSFSRT